MNEKTAKKIIALLEDCPPFQALPPLHEDGLRATPVLVLYTRDFEKMPRLRDVLNKIGKLLDAESSNAKE